MFSYDYQWIRIDAVTAAETAIGDNSNRYRIADADIGHLIKVQVSFADGDNYPESRTSLPFGPIAKPAADRLHAPLTLVSNVGQSNSSTAVITQQYAMGFTLGTHGQGYEISSVSLELAAVPTDLNVSLWISGPEGSPRSGAPSFKLIDFTNPATLKVGLNTFTAPMATLAYQNVNYFIVLSGFGASLSINETTSVAEDAGAETGAHIWDQVGLRAAGSTGRWSSISWRGGVLRLAVEGSRRLRGILAANYAQPTATPTGQEIISAGDQWSVALATGSADRYLIRGLSMHTDNSTPNGGGISNPMSVWLDTRSSSNRQFGMVNTRSYAGLDVWSALPGATVSGNSSYLFGMNLSNNAARLSSAQTRVFVTTGTASDTPTEPGTTLGVVSTSDAVWGTGLPLMAVLGEPLYEMVSNDGQTNSLPDVQLSGALASNNKVASQGFTTGSSVRGYRLQGIGVNVAQAPQGPSEVSVSVHADSGGHRKLAADHSGDVLLVRAGV